MGPADGGHGARAIAPTPERMAAGNDPRAQTPNEGAVAPKPVVAGNGLLDQTPPDAAAPTVARSQAPATPDRAVIETAAASPPSAQDIVPLHANPRDPAAEDAGRFQLAELQARQPDEDTARQQAPATTTAAQVSHKGGPADDPDRIVCKDEPLLGSRFVRHICLTRTQWSDLQGRLQRAMDHGDFQENGFPVISY